MHHRFEYVPKAESPGTTQSDGAANWRSIDDEVHSAAGSGWAVADGGVNWRGHHRGAGKGGQGVKHQAPSSKLQRSSKLQTSTCARPDGVGAWRLKFLWSLELGAWSLVWRSQ